MKRLILLLLAVASVYHMPLAIAAPPTLANHLRQQIDVQDAWRFACAITKADCGEPPTIEFEPLFREYSALGVFIPVEGMDKMVVLDTTLLPLLDPVYAQAVLAHEMTHYIDFNYNRVDPTDACAAEWNGWRTMNAYLVSHGRPDAADYNWQERYGCFGAGESIDE